MNMDMVSRLKPFSMVFLLLALVFGGIAAGVVPAPASATGEVTGKYADAHVTGGNIESAVWSFNPYTKKWHFEVIAGASVYQMVIQLPKQRVEGADGGYEVQPYTLTVDLSRMYYAIPMQREPTRVVYAYEFVDCGVQQVPYNAWQDLLSYTGGGIGRFVYNLFQSGAVKDAYRSAYESCKAKVNGVASAMNAKYPESYVLLSADERTVDVSLPVVGTIGRVKVYDPHFYGVVRYQVDTWSPKTSAEMYPVGTVGVTISGAKGSATATIALTDSSANVGLSDGGAVTASAQLPVADGYIRYVGYLRSTGDVYHLPDPWVINYKGRYVPVESSALVDYWGRAGQLDRALMTTKYLVGEYASFDEFVSKVGSYGLESYASESVSLREQVSADVKALQATLDDAVENSRWRQYVVDFDKKGDISSYALLLLRPVSSSAPAFKLVLSGDVDAEWLGLRPIPAKGDIIDYPREPVTVTRDGGVSFQFTVRNVADVDGSFDWSVTCGDYGILASGTTSVVRSGATVVVPVSGYLQGITDLSKEQRVSCKITVSNLLGEVTDSAMVYLQYKPEVVCQYGVPTCSTKDGQEGYYYCESPYEPAVFQPCPEGQVCEMTDEGAKCVVSSKDKNVFTNAFCSGDQICYIVDGKKHCEACPKGGKCTYVRGEGAKCTGGVTPPPPPPPHDTVYVSPSSGTQDLWRVGAAVAAVGSLLVWVVLI